LERELKGYKHNNNNNNNKSKAIPVTGREGP
jgi:hypothetical protein